jgi:hypothetical protein
MTEAEYTRLRSKPLSKPYQRRRIAALEKELTEIKAVLVQVGIVALDRIAQHPKLWKAYRKAVKK